MGAVGAPDHRPREATNDDPVPGRRGAEISQVFGRKISQVVDVRHRATPHALQQSVRAEFKEVAQMFASVTTGTGLVSKQQAQRVIDQILPRSQSLPGFKGVLFLLDEKGGKGMGIVFYESEEVARASGEARDRLRKEGASEMGASISSLDGYEVVLASGVAELIQA